MPDEQFLSDIMARLVTFEWDNGDAVHFVLDQHD